MYAYIYTSAYMCVCVSVYIVVCVYSYFYSCVFEHACVTALMCFDYYSLVFIVSVRAGNHDCGAKFHACNKL